MVLREKRAVDVTDDEQPRTGIDRRKVITRGTAAAGMFWAVPVISSFANPAAAQVGTPPPGGGGGGGGGGGVVCPDGTSLYTVFVKYDVDAGEFETADNSGAGGNCISGGCSAANEWAVTQLNGAVDDIVEAVGDEQVCITIPAGFSMIDAAAKEGQDCDTTPDAGSGEGTVCFRKEPLGSGVSNVTLELTACVPDEVIANCPP